MRNNLISARVPVTAVALFVALGVFLKGPAAAPLSPLSTDATLQSVASGVAGAIRSRAVAIDVATLPDPRVRAQLAREPGLTLELFPDAFVDAVFDRFDANADGVTWVGHVSGAPLSAVTLVYGGGLLAGTLSTPDGQFQIRPASEAARLANPQASGQMHLITQIDTSQLPPEAEPVEVVLPDADGLSTADAATMADSAGVIDVMVIYTATAQLHAGSQAAMLNLINLSISETNTSYANSDVVQRLRLVHTAPVTYTEVSSFGTNLSRVRSGSGTGLGGVEALRNQYGADLVAMLIHPTSPSACGIAYVMTTVSTAFEPFGYSVTDTACLSPNYTFAHELGHNMGAQHDWYVSTATRPFTYAHGYANPAVGARWRTIMSYNDQCSVQGFSCSRLLAWSNPENRLTTPCLGGAFRCLPQLWFLPGVPPPLGVVEGTRTDCGPGNLDTGCDADNRRTLNNTALTIANLRTSVASTTSDRR
ncbi:MAG: hypothetical protein HQ485_15330 [Acidobacteria bacterium]|jgi:hypothetical protein|nr:hypothetical protein [Acidobacteriota bacterium]